MTRYGYIILSSALLALAACTPAAEGVQHSAQSLGEARDDIADSFTELFTYNPKPKTPLLSTTRYCYKFASDVVCYDQPQPYMTSRIMGVQGGEGARIVSYPTVYDATASYVTPIAVDPVPLPGSPMDTSGPVVVTAPTQIESHDLSPAPFARRPVPVN